MEPRYDPDMGGYIWPAWDDRPQIPPVFCGRYKLPTVKHTIFQGVLMIAFMGAAVVFKIKQSTLDGQCSNLAVLLFTQVALWTISFVIDRYYARVHDCLRWTGYNDFSAGFNRRSSHIFSIVTCSNVVTLIYLAASIKYAPSVMCDWECPYSALNLTVYSTLLHGVMFLAVASIYSRSVRIFNEMSPVPETVAAEGLNSIAQAAYQDAQIEMLMSFITKQAFQIELYKRTLQEVSQRQHEPEFVIAVQPDDSR